MNIDLRNFLQLDLKCKHKRKNYSLLDGQEHTFPSIEDMVVYIDGNKHRWKKFVNWEKFKASSGYAVDIEAWMEKLPDMLKEELIDLMQNKTEITTKLSTNDKGSAFDSFSKPVTELPKMGFNVVDEMILSRIRYCKEDDSIYVETKKGLKLIDRLGAVQRDPSINGLCEVIKETLMVMTGSDKPTGIDEYINSCIYNINNLKQKCLKETALAKDNGTAWEDISIEIGEDRYFIPSKECQNDEIMNCIDIAADNYCLRLFFEMVPGSLFSARIIELKAKYTNYEMMSPNGEGTYKKTLFNNFFYSVVKSGESLTEFRYLKNVFNEFVSYIKDKECFKLESAPRTYADGDIPALFKYSSDLFKKNTPQDAYTRLDDCTNIMTLKSWMNDAEFRLAMAWAYAAVHPTLVTSNIALLLWTGGGTSKSSFVAMIKEAICMASGAKDSDIFFEIKGGSFDEDQRNWVPDGQIGLTKAALVNIDEATTKTIELYKDFSGSAAGNKLATRKNYENTIVTTVKGKFIFTTNKGLQLTNDDGSLLRRVAVIKHIEARNTIGAKDIKTNEEILLEYKKQVPMLLSLGKKALKEIEEMGFSTLDAYAMNCQDITKNLRESTAVSMNTQIYGWIWQELEESNWINVKQKDGTYRFQGGALKSMYTRVCLANGEDPKWWDRFKNFIIEQPAFFVSENKKKAAANFIRVDKTGLLEYSSKVSNSIYILHPLRPDLMKELGITITPKQQDSKDDIVVDAEPEGFDNLCESVNSTESLNTENCDELIDSVMEDINEEEGND